ncbi:protein translocase subunit SecF [Tepidibacter formicigenes]|jgi:preprotein translocase subunit SecF/SecD/SecF fusion protein|uniref:Protein-export membrane protein SecF n=1 Tax=Tepidibacter formicigenes DSM 15518 TaxID=1123349 RepID=A0A1M6MWC3_9FIRM|nr:protein translocase subunit SecF [Tepidibacter formicigenes]SHJ87583.1 protein translocase subunit secF [Tepidibacter formicigenes DSM 15518]
MKIIEKTKLWFGLSLAIIAIGLVIILTSGLNFGIDFTGGTLMEIELHKSVPTEEIRTITDSVDKDMAINFLGEEKSIVQIKTKKDFNSDKRQEVFIKFKEKYNLKNEDLQKAEQFGATVGKEIRNKAIIATVIAAIGMLIYVSFRFELSYGIAAIIALIHDVLILICAYAVFRVPVDSPFVAAVLTVVGYSINDTIVVFDRIRENMKHAKKKDYANVANQSIKQTISRSINTSLTTLTAIVALYVLGVESIKDFTLPLIVGMAAGTYSSIFIASPTWVLLKNKSSI